MVIDGCGGCGCCGSCWAVEVGAADADNDGKFFWLRMSPLFGYPWFGFMIVGNELIGMFAKRTFRSVDS